MHLTLKQARKIRDKSQKEMAKLLDVHVQTYRKLEEKPDTATILQAKKISKFLNLSYDEIFFAM